MVSERKDKNSREECKEAFLETRATFKWDIMFSKSNCCTGGHAAERDQADQRKLWTEMATATRHLEESVYEEMEQLCRCQETWKFYRKVNASFNGSQVAQG